MQEHSVLLQAALRYADAGIPVFPCEPDTKEPRQGSHGFKDATTDPDQIKAWWNEKPYNIAFSPASVGWGIVDTDGAEGIAAFDKLVAEHGSPETFVVQSPRGGRHHYYDGELPTSVWTPGGRRVVGEHIDTRGVGSYALLPPSTAYGGKPYVTLKDNPVATLPAWIADRVRRSDRITSGVSEAELDQPAALDRGRTDLRDLVKREYVAVEGQSGNALTFRVCCRLYDLAISQDRALDLLVEHWNPACRPPWEEAELATIVANAYRYAQNQIGAEATAPASEIFKEALDQLPAEAKRERLPYFHPFSVEEQNAGPADEQVAWSVPKLIPDATSVLLVGAKGSFKSFISHHLLLMLASGRPSMGFDPGRVGPVFYGAHEGFHDMRQRRRKAWELLHEPEAGYPFYLMRGPHVASAEECAAFINAIEDVQQVRGERVAGIALDTMAKCMLGLDENKVIDTGRMIGFVDKLVDTFNAPVIVDHHKAKDGAPSGRGSSNIEAGFSTVLDLDRPHQGRTVELRVRYHKDAPEPEEPWVFEAKPLLNSLILQPISLAEHRAVTRASDRFEPRKIGAALAALLAYGMDSAVTSHVLAAEVAPLTEAMPVEERERIINATAQTLNGLGRLGGRLEAYCDRVGRDRLWHLPEAEPAPAQD